MGDVIRALVAVAWLLAAAYKYHQQVRRSPTPAAVALVAGCLAPVVEFTVKITPVAEAIDQLVGRPGTAHHLGNLAIFGLAFSLQALVVFVTTPATVAARQVRRQAVLLAVAAAALTAAFALAGPPTHAGPLVTGFGLPYTLAYSSYVGYSFVRVARLVWRYARWADHDTSGLGLQLMAVGTTAGAGYAATELVFAALRTAGLPIPVSTEIAAVIPFMVCGMLFGALGITLPRWGPRIRALRPILRWLSSYRAIQVLRPLWLALYRATPGIALHPPSGPWGERLALTNVHRRLHRRVIEIEDGLLRLRPYRDPAVVDRARAAVPAELSGRPLAAVIEASAIAAALDAHTDGRTYVPEPTRPGADPNTADPAGEIDWLCLVGRAYRHSPAIPDLSTVSAAPVRRGGCGCAGRGQ